MTSRPKPDGELDPAGEAGWYLQRERERRGESLAMAGETCGIHPHHLDAIETGDLTRLPARYEALRMIGDYGAHLGFDPQPLVLHYAQILPRPTNGWSGRRRAAPKPLGSAKIIPFPSLRALAPRSAGAIVSCLSGLALVGAAVWLAMAPPQGDPEHAREALSEVAADVTHIIPETTVGSISPIGDPPAQRPSFPGPDQEAEEADRAADGLTGLTELISRELADQNRAEPAAAPQATDGEIVSARPETDEPGRTYGSANIDARLVLKASAPVWVRIEDKQGNVVMTQTLLTGDSYRVPNRPDLVIIARDGGLLTFEIDGVPKGSLGASGEILVGRSLDLESLAKQG